MSTGLPRSTDDAQSLSLVDQLESIGVRPDWEQQQLYSCLANGAFYNQSDVRVLAMVLKGFDFTEVFSPERVTKLCSKYGLVAGD